MMSDGKLQPIIVNRVDTNRKYALAIYGDTNGFSTFVQRSFDDPSIHRTYLEDLYKIAFLYQAKTGCALKLLCDGFLAVHEFETDDPPAPALLDIFSNLEIVYRDVRSAIDALRHPRPDGFRITAAMGHVWSLKLSIEAPAHCVQTACDMRSIHDHFGYPTILAKRMSEGSARAPIEVCQAVKEALEKHKAPYDFKRLPAERRIPSGVFKEDMATLWELRRRKKR